MFSTPPPTLPEHLRKAQALANLICHSWDDRYFYVLALLSPEKLKDIQTFFF